MGDWRARAVVLAGSPQKTRGPNEVPASLWLAGRFGRELQDFINKLVKGWVACGPSY
ncbi:hypothetical protein AWB68_06563 [Caballeronia choica]|uniref:Uncharacterized protein n=1 Tax=Caballeronia choica TaxID=326476 RepID=A0A158KP73_9BURK|nr:hypothetical protein AWB68_06563 [Caballeronia choica]